MLGPFSNDVTANVTSSVKRKSDKNIDNLLFSGYVSIFFASARLVMKLWLISEQAVTNLFEKVQGDAACPEKQSEVSSPLSGVKYLHRFTAQSELTITVLTRCAAST